MQPHESAEPNGSGAPPSGGEPMGGAGAMGDGALLGKYRLGRRIGSGGMGVVYEAEDTVLRRKVALKVMSGLASAAPEVQERFHREALAAARLSHANVVAIHDVGRQDGIDFLVLELVQGGNAQERLDRQGAFPWREATQIASEVCEGVAAAHSAGLIHRDIKPGNVMLASDGHPKLADFGLAKGEDSTVATLTGGGGVVGTPHYMSPEQCRAERVDGRADVYSLGATYFALLTGRPPYAAEAPVQVMFAHCSNPVPDPRSVRPEIPEVCSRIVAKAMAKYPNGRYPSASTMLADLRAALDGGEVQTPVAANAVPGAVGPAESRSWRRRGALLAMVVAALLLAGLAVKQLAGRKEEPAASQPPAAPALPPFRVSLRETGMDIQLGGSARSVAFSPDGTMFAAGASDGEGGVRVWDFNTGQERLSRWSEASIQCVVFSADSSMLGASCEGEILVWDLAQERETRIPVGGEAVQVKSVSFSRDGTTLAAGLEPEGTDNGDDKAARCVLLADLATGATRLLPCEMAWPWSVAYSPDGNLLAAGSMDWNLRIWDVGTDGLRATLMTELHCSCVAFAPNSRVVAVTGDQSIQLWNPYTGVKLGGMTDARGYVTCAAFSPDGALLFTGGEQATVWDVATRKELGRMEGHTAEVWGVAFSHDGSTLATACSDGVVRLRDVSKVIGDRQAR